MNPTGRDAVHDPGAGVQPGPAQAAPGPVPVAHQAGFSRLTIGRSVRRGGVRGAIWYPARARESTLLEGSRVMRVARDAVPVTGKYPLVLISHDSGGGLADHHGTAERLARAGYVVLAITHPGDNEHDLSGVLGPAQLLGRSRHLSRAIDHVLGTHKYASIVKPGCIAGIGCGVGAYSLLLLAGARPDFGRFVGDGGDRPGLLPHWEALVGQIPPDAVIPDDPRLRAAVLLAPAYAYLFDAAALARATIPLLVYDHAIAAGELPGPEGGSPAADWPPGTAFRRVITAASQPFLAGCAPAFEADYPELAPGRAGFDREAFHTGLDATLREFLEQRLPAD